MTDDLELYYARNRQEWRKWLEENHASASGVWLIYYKKNSGKPRVAYDEAVEEALCFGWIDSLYWPSNCFSFNRREMIDFRPFYRNWPGLLKERIGGNF